MSNSSTLGTADHPIRVAIIGSGPAGFFCAGALLDNKNTTVEVDLFDRLPTPYGLVRGGVAPDHQKIKKVADVYARSAASPRFRFFGNVGLGRDVSVEDLLAHYHQVVYAVGNEASRRLGVPGEGLRGCTPASVFVGWYNGHPDYAHANIDLRGVSRVAVVGNGNVAVDVARILARTRAELLETDISALALAELEKAQVTDIYMLGRRGPVQASFTPSELRELGDLEDAKVHVAPEVIDLDPHSRAALEGASRQVRRNVEILAEFANASPEQSRSHTIHLRFLSSPTAITGNDEGRVASITLQHNAIGPDQRPRPTEVFEELAVDLVIPAIGFVGEAIEGVSFDPGRKRIRNLDGRVVDASSKVLERQYVVGWARSGPQGLIGSHKAASREVAALMLEDLARTSLPQLPPATAIVALLESRGVDVVSFHDWEIIDRIERERGARRGSPRDKITDVDEMLQLIASEDEANA